MREKVLLITFILAVIAMFLTPNILDAQKSDTSEYKIETSYIVEELDILEFHELIVEFQKDFGLSNEKLAVWFSDIATATELRTIEFTIENIEMMLLNRYVPFPVTQAAIRGHIYAYYVAKP